MRFWRSQSGAETSLQPDTKMSDTASHLIPYAVFASRAFIHAQKRTMVMLRKSGARIPIYTTLSSSTENMQRVKRTHAQARCSELHSRRLALSRSDTNSVTTKLPYTSAPSAAPSRPRHRTPAPLIIIDASLPIARFVLNRPSPTHSHSLPTAPPAVGTKPPGFASLVSVSGSHIRRRIVEDELLAALPRIPFSSLSATSPARLHSPLNLISPRTRSSQIPQALFAPPPPPRMMDESCRYVRPPTSVDCGAGGGFRADTVRKSCRILPPSIGRPILKKQKKWDPLAEARAVGERVRYTLSRLRGAAQAWKQKGNREKGASHRLRLVSIVREVREAVEMNGGVAFEAGRVGGGLSREAGAGQMGGEEWVDVELGEQRGEVGKGRKRGVLGASRRRAEVLGGVVVKMSTDVRDGVRKAWRWICSEKNELVQWALVFAAACVLIIVAAKIALAVSGS